MGASRVASSSQASVLHPAGPSRPSPTPRPAAGALRTGMMARAGESPSPRPARLLGDLGLSGFTTPLPPPPGVSVSRSAELGEGRECARRVARAVSPGKRQPRRVGFIRLGPRGRFGRLVFLFSFPRPAGIASVRTALPLRGGPGSSPSSRHSLLPRCAVRICRVRTCCSGEPLETRNRVAERKKKKPLPCFRGRFSIIGRAHALANFVTFLSSVGLLGFSVLIVSP